MAAREGVEAAALLLGDVHRAPGAEQHDEVPAREVATYPRVAPDPRMRRAGVAVAVLVLLAGVVAIFRPLALAAPMDTLSPVRSAIEATLLHANSCGAPEMDIDYVYETLVGPGHLDHVGDAGTCCNHCKKQGQCRGYTWVRDAKLPTGDPGQCWLKGGAFVKRAPKLGVTSGYAVVEENHTGNKTKDKDPSPQGNHSQVNDGKHKVEENKTKVEDNKTKDKQEELLKNHTAEDKAKEERQKEAAEKKKEEEDALRGCAAAGEGCLDSHCCKDAGYQCFTKNEYWAQCMVECIPGPSPIDQVSPSPWACQALGDRTPGEAKACSDDGENCQQVQCCNRGGTQCYAKNESYAECLPTCTPGPQLTAPDSKPWTCNPLGKHTLGAAPWVAQQCTSGGDDCKDVQCCAWGGHQCYRQTSAYAQCKPWCTPGEQPQSWAPAWSCEKVGQRTPDLANDAGQPKGQVGWWVQNECAGEYENCLESRCCKAVNSQCYKKNDYWATCKESCSTAPDPNDGNKTWTCEPRGSRSWGLAVKGYPSLFCISLFMPTSYEGDLLRSHLNASAGIFTCDGYDVFAADPCYLGTTQEGVSVNAVLIERIAVGVSQDGTAGNAKLFMAVWDKVIAGGRFRNYDWTMKVDPDAVLIAWRARTHMRPHTGEKVYVVNCNKFPGSPNFPMMYGALEVFSGPAMQSYAENSWKCGQQLPWSSWGEDYYMTHCMDFIGVGRIGDFGVLGDNMCTGANCGDGWTASFHPFKSIGSWMQCWNTANR